MKHTKGNWESARNFINKSNFIIEGDNKLIADVSGVQTTDEEAEANAKLIAAAPELLEALLKAKEELRETIANIFSPLEEKECIKYMNENKAYKLINKAIDKATK